MRIEITHILIFLASRQQTSMITSPSLSKTTSQTTTSSPISNATPHPIQSSVLTMCQSIISSTSSTSDHNLDWFNKLTKHPQLVILAPTLNSPTLTSLSSSSSSSSTSRRAVRIQIINKHDDIVLPSSSSVLPMTPSPASLSSQTTLPMIVNDSTSTFNEYLNATQTIFQHIDSQQNLTTVMENSMGKDLFWFQ